MLCKMDRFVDKLSITPGGCNGIKYISNVVSRMKRIPLSTFSTETSSNY